MGKVGVNVKSLPYWHASFHGISRYPTLQRHPITLQRGGKATERQSYRRNAHRPRWGGIGGGGGARVCIYYLGSADCFKFDECLSVSLSAARMLVVVNMNAVHVILASRFAAGPPPADPHQRRLAWGKYGSLFLRRWTVVAALAFVAPEGGHSLKHCFWRSNIGCEGWLRCSSYWGCGIPGFDPQHIHPSF